MNRVLVSAAGGLALAGAAFLALAAAPAASLLTPDDPSVVALGQQVYAAECAACHGAQLQGAPNWRVPGPDGLLPAPPHDATGHTWHHDGETLFRLTKYGVARLINDPDYVSNMPVYEGVLSDDEIIAVLSYIKSTWPGEIRARHDALENR
ncbi:MAG: cytochrome c [Pseudomonadota bacterium]